jgi:hypothetical protein
MLKIVVDENSHGPACVVLEGQIIEPWVRELDRVCRPLLARGDGLSLDLLNVSFVSREGVRLLRALRDRRATLLHCSAFVAEQLKDPAEARA